MFKLTDDAALYLLDVKEKFQKLDHVKDSGKKVYIFVGVVDDESSPSKFVYRVGVYDSFDPEEEEVFESNGIEFLYLKEDKSKIEGTEFACQDQGEDAKLILTWPNKV